ncbi:MAG TPA: CHASE2 domain-containing protein [Burkholderiales bacterium]|nr:CHASE2 domain-containing protein [Burkholderiales bacterium]
MTFLRAFLRRLNALLRHSIEGLARRLKTNFYLYLAAVFSALIVADAMTLRAVVDMRQQTYDAMVRLRLIKPEPDPDIVIVDIDERSLATMAADYGRWPWPRQVLGEFVEKLEEQAPRAIVFDILFSDPDVFNPDSDAYFNEVIARTNNTFFPMLRLPPENDRLSEMRPDMIPGAQRVEETAASDGTVAIVLPFFEAVQASARLGTNNIYPDRDGIARRYRLWHDVHGWRLPSLPLRVAQSAWASAGAPQDMLLNWRGKPFTYRYVSFSDVFFDLQKKKRARPAQEFRNRIVIIGSTAPSLFDIKATSVARAFPGVEILATAIDNLRHRDWIRTPASPWPNVLIALLIVWATGMALYRNPDSDRFDRVFGLSQIGLLGFSYASINFTSYFLNLAGPVFIGLLYFSVARAYAAATARALEKSAVARTLAGEGSGATLMLIQLQAPDGAVSAGLLRRLRKALGSIGSEPRDVELIKGRQRGVWGLFDGTLVLTWAYPGSDAHRRARVEADVAALRERLPELVQRLAVNDEAIAAVVVRNGTLGTGDRETMRTRWRALLGDALRDAAQIVEPGANA